jgi:dolichol-phosphate mannosyltransferase
MEAANLSWELVLVDDRAADAPWPTIVELAASDPRIRGLHLTRNHGQQLAIWAGLEAARGAWVAVIDCDFQDDPGAIARLHDEALRAAVDGVVVDRGEWSDSPFRRAASSLFYRLFRLLAGIHLRNVGNFGIYSRRMVDMLLRFEEQEVFLPIMVSLTGLKTTQLRLDRSARAMGKSSYSFWRLMGMATAVIVRFSDRPLKLSALLGLVFSGVAALASVYLLVGSLLGAFTVPGWTSIVLSLWFLAGLIMLVLGVHGFYLSRVFAEVRRRPRLLVEETTFAGAAVRP